MCGWKRPPQIKSKRTTTVLVWKIARIPLSFSGLHENVYVVAVSTRGMLSLCRMMLRFHGSCKILIATNNQNNILWLFTCLCGVLWISCSRYGLRKTAKDINDLDALMVWTVQRTTASNRLRPKKQPFICLISCGCRCSVEVVTLRNGFVTPEPNSNDPSNQFKPSLSIVKFLHLKEGAQCAPSYRRDWRVWSFAANWFCFAVNWLCFTASWFCIASSWFCFAVKLFCLLPVFLLQYR